MRRRSLQGQRKPSSAVSESSPSGALGGAALGVWRSAFLGRTRSFSSAGGARRLSARRVGQTGSGRRARRVRDVEVRAGQSLGGGAVSCARLTVAKLGAKRLRRHPLRAFGPGTPSPPGSPQQKCGEVPMSRALSRSPKAVPRRNPIKAHGAGDAAKATSVTSTGVAGEAAELARQEAAGGAVTRRHHSSLNLVGDVMSCRACGAEAGGEMEPRTPSHGPQVRAACSLAPALCYAVALSQAGFVFRSRQSPLKAAAGGRACATAIPGLVPYGCPFF